MFETVLRVPTGVDLYVRSLGTGPPLVLIHGGPGLPHQQLLPYCDELAAHFRLIYYDQRGCGRSGDPPQLEQLTWDDHAADLRALIAALGLKRPGLIGFSWGGLLLMRYLTQPGATAAAIALVGSTPARSDGWVEAFLAEKARREDRLGVPAARRALATSDLRARDPVAYDRARFLLDVRSELADPSLAEHLTPVVFGERGTRTNVLTWSSVGEYDLRPALARLDLPALVHFAPEYGCLLRLDVLVAAGGLDERYQTSRAAFADYGLLMKASGHRVACFPLAVVVETDPVAPDAQLLERDRREFLAKWSVFAMAPIQDAAA
ncbi:MAG: alpha/beta fold hydrolase [Chloroflexi bacterium]|nr:alpha/beta fold hydrolase [Chloroflexota bacterium]